MLCDGGRNAAGLRSKHFPCCWRLCLVALRQIYSHVGCQIWLRCLIDITGAQNVTRRCSSDPSSCSSTRPSLSDQILSPVVTGSSSALT